MPFKIAVLQQSCDYVLLERRHGAGIKSKLFLKYLYKPFGEYHIAYTQGWRNCFGKAIEVDNVVLLGEREERFL